MSRDRISTRFSSVRLLVTLLACSGVLASGQASMACINVDELIANARMMATPGKGLLAADESTSTVGKRVSCCGLALK